MIRRSGENVAAVEENKNYLVLDEGHSRETVGPDGLAEFCAERLAYFKVSRYWAYEDDLPRTPPERVIKSELTEGVPDLQVGAYDRVAECWR